MKYVYTKDNLDLISWGNIEKLFELNKKNG